MRPLILPVLLILFAPSAQAQWRLSPTPRVLIGSADGADAEQFNQIMGLVRQSNGNLVVANMGSSELRFFDSVGKHVRNAGRSGGGPGEFRQLFALFRGPADSLMAYDVAQGFHVFDPIGRFARTIAYGRDRPAPMRLWPYGWFDDGTQLAGAQPPRDRARQGRWVDSMSFFRMDPSGERMAEIGRFPFFEFVGSTLGPMPVVFGPTPAVAVRGSRYCIGSAAEYLIRCAELDSRNPVVVVRRADPPTPVTPEAIKQYQDSYRSLSMEGGGAASEQLKAQRESILQQAVFARQQPYFSRLLLAENGELWVQRYRSVDGMPATSFLGPVSKTPREWDVFDRSGVWRTTVSVPARFKPFEVGAGYVLGVLLGEDDVEQVALYALQRK
jgi:hypothetical protein